MKNFLLSIAIAISMTVIINGVVSYEDKQNKQAYIEELRSINHEIIELQSDKKLITLSQFVCGILDEGQSADDAIFGVLFDQKKRDDVAYIYAAIVVKESIEYFCPIYRFQTEAWVK